jgi:glyoxylase-like metal-dependent hydrolase (beta-lactamase superfamily II)
VARWIHAENIHLFGDRITPAQRAQVEALVGPDQTTDKPMTLDLGGRKLEIRPVQGHTGGDLAVYVPDARVLFTGDMLWRRRAPNIIDGKVGPWTATVAEFERSPAEVFVPGHGDVADRKDVADFHAYLTDLAAFTADARRMGLAGDALADAVVARLKARYDWPFLENGARREAAYMDAELAGTKRVPQP